MDINNFSIGPLLGETFQFYDQESNFKFFAEQFSVNPYQSACYCESTYFISEDCIGYKQNFIGTALEISFPGYQHIKLTNTSDHFICQKPILCITNLMTTSPQIELQNKMVVTNLTNSDIAEIHFKKSVLKGQFEIRGEIKNVEGETILQLTGASNTKFEIENIETAEVKTVWQKQETSKFTNFYLKLNEINPQNISSLLDTDSRFRSDIRALEQGNLKLAAEEKLNLTKLNLEQARKSKSNYEPVLFKKITNDTFTIKQKWLK